MGQPRKVMVVDDEPDVVVFLCTWLGDLGYEAVGEYDADMVVESALREAPSLILLDVNMPSQSGIQVYRKLREEGPLQGLPVIFITGVTDLQLFGSACSPLPEPAARIEKPIDLAVLERAISVALDGKGRA